MKILKYLVFILVLVGLIIVAAGLFLPSKTQVERSIVIDADPQTVYGLIVDFKEFNRWSPWAQDDPDLVFDYLGAGSGEGAIMDWRGDPSASGIGRQEILAAEPYHTVEVGLSLGGDMPATGRYRLEPVAEGTRVTWNFEAVHGLNLMYRYRGTVLEDAVANRYERGLTNLKNLAESLPAIVTEEVSYSAGGAELKGYLAMPRAAANRPAVLVVHEWWGHNDYVRERAEMLADLGYVAFALDMYGDGKVASHPQDAQKFMREVVNNQEIAQARFDAALALLKTQPGVNPEQVAAIGYCFGGAVVLSMARAGADLDGVVSFHGALAGLAPVAEGVTAQFLVLNGGADPMITDEQIANFKNDMDAAGLSYEFVEYETAKHAFTNPAATEKGEKFGIPLEYNAEADADSWKRMEEFLAGLFGERERFSSANR